MCQPFKVWFTKHRIFEVCNVKLYSKFELFRYIPYFFCIPSSNTIGMYDLCIFQVFKDQLSAFKIDSLQNAKHLKRILKLQWSDIVSEAFVFTRYLRNSLATEVWIKETSNSNVHLKNNISSEMISLHI